MPFPLIDTIYMGIREQIINRTIPPGTRLSEPALSKKWQVSRTPIREALRRLEAEGLVTSSRYKGFVVNMISLEDMDQIYRIKVLLEGLAGRLSTPIISKDSEKLDALRKLLWELEACFEKRDVEGYFAINDKFHSYLWQFCGNKWLVKILEQLTSQVNRFIVKSLYVPNRMEKSVREHLDIFKRIERGDEIGVEKAIAIHFKNASDDLRRELTNTEQVTKE